MYNSECKNTDWNPFVQSTQNLEHIKVSKTQKQYDVFYNN